jgi:ABC-type lipoprotein release transport system permease subunit
VRGQDDDDWVGEPPEGRHNRERARPEFWRSNVPLSITGIGLGVALLILLIVWLA